MIGLRRRKKEVPESEKANSGASKDAAGPLKKESLPRHIAIIMDGNGRWAQARGLPRVEGHRAGAKTVRMVVEECRRLEIRYLTLFCFSSENWSRPEQEVSALMRLFMQYLESEAAVLAKNGVRLRAVGDHAKLPPSVKQSLDNVISKTADQNGLDLILAISYGSRDEIVNATKKIASACLAGSMKVEEISAQSIQQNLYAPDVPDPDLLIRTSAEYRISNFLLWQLAYSEIVVSSLMWPEFGKEELERCLREYAGRSRRFGLTAEQQAASTTKP